MIERRNKNDNRKYWTKRLCKKRCLYTSKENWFRKFILIFVSGVQAPKGEINEVATEDIGEQTRLVFEEIKSILEEAGASIDNVVKAVIYLKDINDFEIVSPIRAEYFKNSMPVSTMVEVGGFVRKGSKIEIEVTAIIEK